MSNNIVEGRQVFAQNLVRLMKENGERQVDIARLLGVTKSAVSAYVRGDQLPRIDKLDVLAQHYGITRGELL